MENIQRRIRFLEAYAIVSALAFGVMALCSFSQTKRKFDEISVERVNVVDKNGQLRAVIANSDRMPDPIIGGKTFKTQRPPGMIFYNGLGDEGGGLIVGARVGGGQDGAYRGVTFARDDDEHSNAPTYTSSAP